ncbi:hypothetical protein PAMP_002373 [Pampus punctatissimus]
MHRGDDCQRSSLRKLLPAAMFPSCCSKPADGSTKRSYISKLLLGVFVVYMLHTAWLLYGFLNTKPCDGGEGEHCISSYLTAKPRLQLSVFTCLVPDKSQLNLAVKIDPFDPHSTFERQVNVSLPEETRANGTLYVVVYVHKASVSPLEDSREVHYAAQLTIYITPTHREGQRDTQKKLSIQSEVPVSHWRPHLSINMMSEDFTFNKAGLPSDVRRYMRVSQEGRQMMYLPLLLVNELIFRVRDLMEISSSTVQLPLTVSYEGISLRRFRFWVHLQDVVYSLRQFGFTEENIDEIKETLVGSNLYLLVLTALITALQLICEFLALKNDISSWRKKKSMVGMSRKSGIHILVLLGLSSVYQRSYFLFGLLTSKEMKSVSHLQGSVLMYRGVNTLISDLCSFATFFYSSGSFSSSHQLSCFRDELLFLLYLYQRRCYAPKARRRESGTHSKKVKTQYSESHSEAVCQPDHMQRSRVDRLSRLKCVSSINSHVSGVNG